MGFLRGGIVHYLGVRKQRPLLRLSWVMHLGIFSGIRDALAGTSQQHAADDYAKMVCNISLLLGSISHILAWVNRLHVYGLYEVRISFVQFLASSTGGSVAVKKKLILQGALRLFVYYVEPNIDHPADRSVSPPLRCRQPGYYDVDPLGYSDVDAPGYSDVDSPEETRFELASSMDIISRAPFAGSFALKLMGAGGLLEEIVYPDKYAFGVFDKQALDLIAIKGYDEKIGARPLHRYMDTEVVEQIVQYLLNENLGEKPGTNVRVTEGSLSFVVKRRKEGGQDDYDQLPYKKHKNER
ncbi:hypothetical protein Tco_0126512 [Tanacetum coccineum]